MDCESCGAAAGLDDEANECKGCGLLVCQSCVDVFEHMGKEGLHGEGDPAEAVVSLRGQIRRLTRVRERDNRNFRKRLFRQSEEIKRLGKRDQLTLATAWDDGFDYGNAAGDGRLNCDAINPYRMEDDAPTLPPSRPMPPPPKDTRDGGPPPPLPPRRWATSPASSAPQPPKDFQT